MGVGLHRCPVVGKGWVRSLLVVVSQPRTDFLPGLSPVLESVQVDALVLERAPEAFDEDVIHPSAFAVHRDLHPSVFEHLGEILAGELAALIRVEDLRAAVLD